MLSSSGYWVFSQPEVCFGDQSRISLLGTMYGPPYRQGGPFVLHATHAVASFLGGKDYVSNTT
jgi:hypothetical protein